MDGKGAVGGIASRHRADIAVGSEAVGTDQDVGGRLREHPAAYGNRFDTRELEVGNRLLGAGSDIDGSSGGRLHGARMPGADVACGLRVGGPGAIGGRRAEVIAAGR